MKCPYCGREKKKDQRICDCYVEGLRERFDIETKLAKEGKLKKVLEETWKNIQKVLKSSKK